VKAKQLKAKDLALGSIETCYEHPHEESERNSESTQSSKFGPCVWLCLPFTLCRKDDSAKPNSGEQLLYCSICEAEVLMAKLLLFLLRSFCFILVLYKVVQPFWSKSDQKCIVFVYLKWEFRCWMLLSEICRSLIEIFTSDYPYNTWLYLKKQRFHGFKMTNLIW